jgi:glucose/arabinose dehydrogenase
MLKRAVSMWAGLLLMAGALIPQPSVASTDVIPPRSSIALTRVASGLTQPVFVTHAGDDRLFVVEQAGVIKIVKNGAVLPTPFLNITSQVFCCGEQGLLGLAFEPNYATTGRFYVYHTVQRNNGTDNVIARYTVGSNPDVANPASRVEVLYIPHRGVVDGQPQDNDNHNGGWLAFGPDGMLYAGSGDGGAGGDPFCAAQNESSLLGKILRLNVVGQSTYALPAGQTTPAWHIGLRNPWRASFDRQTGDLYIADVGQGAREEVSLAHASTTSTLNFGWPQREGAAAYPTSCPASSIPRTEPILDYARNIGTSITGGYVYRGKAFPALNGLYFFGDYGSGKLFAAWPVNAQGFTYAEVLNARFNVASFGEDKDGELYVVSYAGSVFKIGMPVFAPNISR